MTYKLNGSPGVIAVDDNGSLIGWMNPETGQLIISKHEVIVQGQQRTRVSHICFPFGKATGIYDGLAAHGLTRTGAGHIRKSIDFTEPDEKHVEMEYDRPFRHKIAICVESSSSGKTLYHKIEVTNLDSVRRPISLGFHPYFATNGQEFAIQYGDFSLNSDTLKVDQPLFIAKKPREKLLLKIGDQTITLELIKGYTDFCIWTDLKDKYICVEPVLGANDHSKTLESNEIMGCVCFIELE